MIGILDELVKYLASTTDLVAGTDIFYNEIPALPAKCVLVQEIQTNEHVPVQIDAELHRIKVTVRNVDNTSALALAKKCWNRLITSDETFDTNSAIDTTGFITLLNDVTVQISVYGNPVWERSDQQGRKYFSFYCVVLTKR